LIALPLTADDEHFVFLIAAMEAGKKGDPVDVQEVISHMNALFETYEFNDRHGTEYDYVINTSDVIPETPCNTRDRMWKWIERISKKFHQEINVEGPSGEYIYLAGSDWTLSDNDFDTNNDGKTVIGDDLAEKMHTLLEFRAEWLKFTAKLESRHKKKGDKQT